MTSAFTKVCIYDRPHGDVKTVFSNAVYVWTQGVNVKESVCTPVVFCVDNNKDGGW